MTRSGAHEAAVHASTTVYAALLIAYPRAFRREYGRQMTQVFRTSCLQSMRGTGELGRFWLRALADLVSSATAERASVARRQNKRPVRYLYLAALLVSVVTGYVHLRVDADQLVFLLLLVGAFLCGVAHPAGAWRWAVIAGLGIPIALAIGHGSPAALFPHRDSDLPVPLPLVQAIFAAYGGAVFHRLLPWSKSFTQT
jgi:hypothetical protein